MTISATFPYLFASGLEGYAKEDLDADGVDMQPLFEAILRHVPPRGRCGKPLQLQVTTLDYSEYLGRIVIGKIHNGIIRMGQQAALVTETGTIKAKISKLMGFEGLKELTWTQPQLATSWQWLGLLMPISVRRLPASGAAGATT